MDSFVVARYLAVALVTPFSVASTLMTYFMSVMFSVSTPLMSMASQLDGAQRYRESRRFFLRATKLTTTVATLGGVLLICNGKTLLTVWLGKDLLAAYPVVVILTLAYVSDLGQCTSINLLCSRGRHQPLAYWTVLEGLANLGLSIYWAPHYGIIGVALGTTIPMLVTKLIVQPWYTLNVAEVSGREYLATIGRPLFVGLFCLATSRLMPVLPGQLWVLCFSVMWQSLLFGLLSYIVVLNADERRSLVSRFTKNVRLLPAAT
jgi:O-antigen/teichoic acid export membrane protein